MTVTYPIGDDTHFDMDYYLEKHMPLCKELFKEHGLRGSALRSGQGKGPGGSDLNYASVDLIFGSLEQLQAGLASGGAQVMADVPKYTNVKPHSSFSEISIDL